MAPDRPAQGRQDLNVFFVLISKRSLAGGGGPVAPPTGDRPVGPPGGPVAPPAGDRGGLSPPHGRPGQAAYIRPPPHSLLSFDLKKSKKIQKKERGEKKGSGEALPNSALVIYR